MASGHSEYVPRFADDMARDAFRASMLDECRAIAKDRESRPTPVKAAIGRARELAAIKAFALRSGSASSGQGRLFGPKPPKPPGPHIVSARRFPFDPAKHPRGPGGRYRVVNGGKKFALSDKPARRKASADVPAAKERTGYLFDMKRGDKRGQTTIMEEHGTFQVGHKRAEGRGTPERLAKAKERAAELVAKRKAKANSGHNDPNSRHNGANSGHKPTAQAAQATQAAAFARAKPGGEHSEITGKFYRGGQALPARTADTMSDAIAMSSPSGRMSKRANAAATERLRVSLFGKEGLPRISAKQPTAAEADARQAARIQDLKDAKKRIKAADARYDRLGVTGMANRGRTRLDRLAKAKELAEKRKAAKVQATPASTPKAKPAKPDAARLREQAAGKPNRPAAAERAKRAAASARLDRQDAAERKHREEYAKVITPEVQSRRDEAMRRTGLISKMEGIRRVTQARGSHNYSQFGAYRQAKEAARELRAKRKAKP